MKSIIRSTKEIPDISTRGGNIVQTKGLSYPKDSIGRSFQQEWFLKFPWLEYSASLDAVFCYPCRQFLTNGTKENVYTLDLKIGKQHWKKAYDIDENMERGLFRNLFEYT